MKKTPFMKQTEKGPKVSRKAKKKSGKNETMDDYMKRRDKEEKK